MGFTNWLLNRANSTSGNSSITVQATSPAFLDGEVRKMERKGYVRVGNPYTAVEYGRTTFYQSMALGQQQVVQATPQQTIGDIPVDQLSPETQAALKLMKEKQAEKQKAREERRAKRNAQIKATAKKGMKWFKSEFFSQEEKKTKKSKKTNSKKD